MNNVIRVLVLEDDEGQQKVWSRESEEFNSSRMETHGPNIELELVSNAREAKSRLSSWDFDVFVSDLKVPATDAGRPTPDAGNRAVAFAVENAACPVVIFSGYTKDFVPPFEGWPGRVFERSVEEMHMVFEWILSKRPMLDALSGVRDCLRRDAARMFHKSLWARWESDSADAKAEVLLRQMTAYMTENLSMNEEEFPASSMEHYFEPSLRERLHTGDIIRCDGDVWVLVSAPCDLARSYPEFLLLIRCKKVDLENDEWKGLKADDLSRKSIERLNRYLCQNHDSSSHFLPPLGDEGPWLADFKIVSSVPSDQADKLVGARLASISPAFSANLRHRFIAHLGRPGQPALEPGSVHQSIRRLPGGRTAD